MVILKITAMFQTLMTVSELIKKPYNYFMSAVEKPC